MTDPDNMDDRAPETGPNEAHIGQSDNPRDTTPSQGPPGTPGPSNGPGGRLSERDVDWHVRVLTENGLALIPLEEKDEEPFEFKKPAGGEQGQWRTRPALTREQAVHYLRNDNTAIGARVGENGLLDIDIDLKKLRTTRDNQPAHVGFDMEAAGRMILARCPLTSFVFGRDQYPVSHALYRTAAPFTNENIKLNDGREIIELRGLSKQGKVGLQTVMPPSRHRRGSQERRSWSSQQMESARRSGGVPILPVLDEKGLDELRTGLKEGVAILQLTMCWPFGNAHAYCLALAGWLAKAEWNEEDTLAFIWEVKQLAGAGGQSEYRVLAQRVESTFKQYQQGNQVSGWIALEGFCGASVMKHVGTLLDIDSDDGVVGNSTLLDIKDEACRLAILHQLRDANLMFVSGNVGVRITEMPAHDIMRYHERHKIDVPKTQLLMSTLAEIPLANLINKHVPLHKTKRAPTGKLKRRRVDIGSADAKWLLSGTEFGSIHHDLNPILGISPVPLMSNTGALTADPGYSGTHMMWVSWGGEALDVPTHPTEDDAKNAVQALNDALLLTFSFDEWWERDEATRKNVLHADWNEDGKEMRKPLNRIAAIGGLMTAVLRPGLTRAPYLAVTSPQARTGKNLLMDTFSHLSLRAKPVQVSLGDGAEEHAKRIPHALALGSAFLCFTNVDGKLASADLEAYATDGEVRIRLFGTTEGERLVHNRGVVGFTGNQSDMPPALIKRCLRIVLNAHHENPEERSFEGKESPPIIALRERPKLLSHVFTIARWWCQNRKTLKDRVKGVADGSFEDWTDMVRRPLMALTGVDIDGTIKEAMQASSSVVEERRIITSLWNWAKAHPEPLKKDRTPTAEDTPGVETVTFTIAWLREQLLKSREFDDMDDTEKELYRVLEDLNLASREKMGIFSSKRLAPLNKRVIDGYELTMQASGRVNTYTIQRRGTPPAAGDEEGRPAVNIEDARKGDVPPAWGD